MDGSPDLTWTHLGAECHGVSLSRELPGHEEALQTMSG